MRLRQEATVIANQGIRNCMPRNGCRALGILVAQQASPGTAHVQQNLREQIELGPFFQKKGAQLLRTLSLSPLLAGRGLFVVQIKAIFFARLGKDPNQSIVENIEKVTESEIALTNPLHDELSIRTGQCPHGAGETEKSHNHLGGTIVSARLVNSPQLGRRKRQRLMSSKLNLLEE